MESSRHIGSKAESAVWEYLKDEGYRLLERNFYTRGGEIDIIAYEGDILVFIEVKYRKTAAFGLPSEAVGYHKQKRIIRAANEYIYMKNIDGTKIRFDVVEAYGKEMSINLIRDAFQLS